MTPTESADEAVCEAGISMKNFRPFHHHHQEADYNSTLKIR
jgi:hypothetical protein